MSSLSIVVSRPRGGMPETAFRGMAEKISAAVGEEIPFAIVSHLYDADPQGPVFQFLRELPGDLLILAPLYPRATHLVLRANGLDVELGDILNQAAARDAAAPAAGHRIAWCLDYRDFLNVHELAEHVRQFVRARSNAAAPVGPDPAPMATQWRIIEEDTRPRWYPVIDTEKCTQCYECINFCLFGVFDVDPSQLVFVAQPDACRPGCPACARVCPQGAIVFPLYSDPVIAGANGKGSGNGHGGAQFSPLTLLNPSIPPIGDYGQSPRTQAEAERQRHVSGSSAGRETASGNAQSGKTEAGKTEVPRQPPSPPDFPELDRWVDELDSWDP